MKKTVFMILIIASTFVKAEWQNALTPPGKKESIILASNGKLNYNIYSNSKCKPAAEYLKRNLHLITGAELNDNAPLKIILNEKVAGLGRDGYELKVKNGNILLNASNVNGINNAITAFLEEDLGWRYYQKDQKAISPAGEINKANITPRRYIPPFFQRSVYSFWAFDKNWVFANKTKKGEFGKYFVHTFFKFIPPKEFRKQNPDFFALSKGKRVKNWREGQLCITNEKLRKILVNRLLKAIADNPGIKFIAVSQNDADGYCECKSCSKLLEKYKKPSGALLSFINKVAKDVAKTYPNIIIVTEAYRYTLDAPEKIVPAKNVVVRLCLNNRISSYPFFFVSETNDMKVLNSWSSITNRLLVWDYMTNFRHYLMPRADLPVLERNIRLYRDKKVFGVMLQTNYNNEIGTQAAMRAWVCAKLLWNPDLSIEKLANDYICGFWGKKISPFMKKYNSLLINEWKQFHSNNKPGTPFHFSKQFHASASLLLEKAKNAAKEYPDKLRLIELETLTLDYYLLQNGIKRKADVAAYQKVLSEFTEKLKKLKIKYLAEGIYNKMPQRIEQFKDRIRMSEYTQNIPEDHIVLPATWNVYIHKGQIKDNKSLVGRAMKQNADSRWGIQWRLEDFSQLKPGKYKVRIRARADKKMVKGIGTTVGIYNTAKSSHELTRKIKASELDNKEYKWLDCGTFKMGSDRLFLFTATVKDGAFKTFYADAVEFIPVK